MIFKKKREKVKKRLEKKFQELFKGRNGELFFFF